MKKRLLAIIMVLVFAVTAVSGCGSEENGEGGSEGNPSQDTVNITAQPSDAVSSDKTGTDVTGKPGSG